MNWAEMVVAIVAISVIGSILRAKFGVPRTDRVRRRRGSEDLASGSAQPDPESDRMRDEIKTLKERIVVLERITTESNAAVSLDREIEKLR
jgi:hypothetical protein